MIGYNIIIWCKHKMCSVPLRQISISTAILFLCVQNLRTPLRLHRIWTRSLCTGHHAVQVYNRKYSHYPAVFTPHYWTPSVQSHPPTSYHLENTLLPCSLKSTILASAYEVGNSICLSVSDLRQGSLDFQCLPFHCKRQNCILFMAE